MFVAAENKRATVLFLSLFSATVPLDVLIFLFLLGGGVSGIQIVIQIN